MSATMRLIVIGAFGTVPERLGEWTRGIGNQKKNQDHSNYSIPEIGQNNQKSPGHLGKLAQTLNDHQLILVWKFRRYIIIKPITFLKKDPLH